MYWGWGSGRRHAGLAASASWQRAAEERYDDTREMIVREKSRFLARGVGWGQPPAAFRSKPPSLRGRRSYWRTRECGRPIAAAA